MLATVLLCASVLSLDVSVPQYRSSSGERYRYDLTQPADRIRYSIDPATRMMDRVDPLRDIERITNPGHDYRGRVR